MRVTILILIDGFLQYGVRRSLPMGYRGHNPYFNRWFSAIKISKYVPSRRRESDNPYFNRWFSAISIVSVSGSIIIKSHNPYFNRWFSAISYLNREKDLKVSHNPYFNRWFSAISV